MQAAKGYKGMGMEGGIARWYAKLTRKSLPEFEALAQRMAANLSPGARVLEVAPGPGYFAIELAKLGKFEITGLDISNTFVEIARRNAQQQHVTVDFQQGNASQMPFADASFDLIVCRAAFKNFSEPVRALAEMRRVLRPGGKALIIDLRRDTPQREIDNYIDAMDTGSLNTIFMKWTFRFMLLKRAYTREEFEKMIAESGWQKYNIGEAPVGFEITLEK
ncbi:MAG TPA: class I SAM-dependent methyltransferase [Candidatus Dormibacteraeota bacterium]|nr:class I SAM-dependent methyltransferase [Candidatus Dormibacteraeota bacterium]